MPTPKPLGWGRSLLFASGDFGCNLYWQSMTFYLLFFYTETLGLSAAVAGLILASWFIISQSIKNPKTIATNDQATKVNEKGKQYILQQLRSK